jgi:high affinity Mn2+ porin
VIAKTLVRKHPVHHRLLLLLTATASALLPTAFAPGQTPGPATQPAAEPGSEQRPTSPPPKPEVFSVHGQATVISQDHDAFHAPYQGLNSLPRREGWKTSVTGTLFLGARTPWPGGEAYFDPEIAGGEGFGGVRGIAGFTNGEIPRVGTPEPKPYVARLFYRQNFDLGGEKQWVEAQQNQLAGYVSDSRLTVSLGKLAASDFFDNNAYSHDPRGQFENWAIMENGAWDYAADTRGYTLGGVVELNLPTRTLRYGAFAEPKEANGGTLDSHVPQALSHNIEFEDRWQLHKHPGAIRVLAFANTAHMGNYRKAIDHPGPSGPDITLSRTYSTKYGFGLSFEQELIDGLGIFARLGWNDGHTESWAFTEIDRTFCLGLSLKGARWHRPNDVIGVAYVANGISKDHRDYLAAGGYGFLIGDGKLSYGLEQVGEIYYLIKIYDHVFVTADAQFIGNPAYNRDRGPVAVASIRAHIEF